LRFARKTIAKSKSKPMPKTNDGWSDLRLCQYYTQLWNGI